MTEKLFKVADLRELDQQVANEQISYGRMVEIINERVSEYARQKAWEAFKAAKELMWGPMTRYGEEVAKKDFEKHWEENK